jgi:hypothetical protein
MKRLGTIPPSEIASKISFSPDRRFLARPQLLTRLEAPLVGATCLFQIRINESLSSHL